MFLAGVIGLVGATYAIGRIQQSEEETGDRAKDLRIARAIAAVVRDDVDIGLLRSIQSVLPYDQILVYRAGQNVFTGPAITNTDFELDVTASFPGGRVELRDYDSPPGRWPLEVSLVMAAVVVLVIGAALVAASLLTRALQMPIDRAVEAADRVAGGDLRARIGDVVPEELARLATAFDSMASRLEAADHDKREFLADVAHEIATPVNAITGLASALADGTLRSDGERREAAALIDMETARLVSLLEDLRHLTTLDLAELAGREAVDLGDVCRSIRARFIRAASDAGVDLAVDVEHLDVVSDRRLLETILDNLVSNAIRYTPAGGRVSVRVTRRSRHVEIVIADTGIGIDRGDLERIFDRFYRVDRARARATGGSGLGLALARRAAFALGARIEVASEVGKGSEFTVILPAHRRGSREAP
jgi:two-component system sensor histidine kinase BaeS